MKKSGALPRLVLVGDVAVEFVDPKKQMKTIAPYFRESAIAFCNCKWPLSDRGAPWPGKAGRVVRSAPEKIETYAYCGFNVVTLANNHIMNFGPEGLLQTIEILDANGIKHCGAGKNLEEEHRPAIVEWKETKIAVLGYTSVFTAGFETGKNKPGMAVIRTEVLDVDRGRSCMEWLARMSRLHGTSWKIRDGAGEPVAKGGKAFFV